MKAMHFLVIIGFISSALAKDPVYLNNAQKLDDVSLDATCSPPTRLGGLGYCGLGYCEYAEKWSCTGSGKCAVCSFLKGKNQQGLRYDISKPLDYQMYLDRVTSYDCPNGQSKDARCTSEALAALIKGPGIKAAYCNDQFLVVHSDLTSNYPSWISDIPNPPGGGEGHTNMEQTLTHIFCQMGTESMYPAYGYYKFPLKTTLLKGSHYRNNMNLQAYPSGPTRNSAAGYLSSQLGAGASPYVLLCHSTRNVLRALLLITRPAPCASGHDYGLPTRGPVGLTIAGQVRSMVSQATPPHTSLTSLPLSRDHGSRKSSPSSTTTPTWSPRSARWTAATPTSARFESPSAWPLFECQSCGPHGPAD
jgi:hypothetical protein